jgi:hypothetical protein
MLDKEKAETLGSLLVSVFGVTEVEETSEFEISVFATSEFGIWVFEFGISSLETSEFGICDLVFEISAFGC